VSEVWPVYKGASFKLWEPDTRVYYDSVDADEITAQLQRKRLSQGRTASSAFAELPKSVLDDPATLPCRRARIAFRDVTRATDSRTLVAALIPPDRVIVNQAPYLLQTAGSARDEAYLLGVLSSMPCDWQARRTVELHMTFEQLNLLTIPDPGEGHPVRDRVAHLAGCLAARDQRFQAWAAEVGVPVGVATTDFPAGGGVGALCELDACVAYLYGLNEADIAVVYDTFGQPGQWDERRDTVLGCYRRIPETQR
jgi:hypothetical protein